MKRHKIQPGSRTIVGVDGCRAGWLCVAKSGNTLHAWISPDMAAALARASSDALFGVDIPIGLATVGRRRCDEAARKMLGSLRCRSVFSPPVRGALGAATYAAACRIHRDIDGRAISRQAFGLFTKLREVDGLLRSHPDVARQVIEVHPEISFALWRGRPMAHGKKSIDGRAERTALVERQWPGLIDRLHAQLPPTGYRRDDLLDAIAALWSAMRHADKRAKLFPPVAERDGHGLRMQIVG